MGYTIGVTSYELGIFHMKFKIQEYLKQEINTYENYIVKFILTQFN